MFPPQMTALCRPRRRSTTIAAYTLIVKKIRNFARPENVTVHMAGLKNTSRCALATTRRKSRRLDSSLRMNVTSENSNYIDFRCHSSSRMLYPLA